MSHPRHLLTELYNQGKGLRPVTHDLVFKKLLTDTPIFLQLLLQEALPLPSEIIDIKAVNSALVAIERKTLILDLLLHVTVQTGSALQHHVVNVEVTGGTTIDTVSQFGAYGALR